MPIGKKLNCVEKAEINVMKANTSMFNRQIAKIVNWSESVVRKYLKDPVGYRQKSSHGRPSKITKIQKPILIRSACNSTKSSRALCKETGLDITLKSPSSFKSIHRSENCKNGTPTSTIAKEYLGTISISHMSCVNE